MRKAKDAGIYRDPALLCVLLLGSLNISRADLKVGSYSWAHHWESGNNYGGTSRTNQYGGGYSHLDLAWTWTVEQGHTYIQNDWTTVANCLDDNPGNYAGHTGTQYANYAVKKYYPSLWTRIKAHSDAGRFDGSELNWQEGYATFGGDEYMLRSNYISYRFCMDNFGYAPLISSAYDLDALPWTVPKVQTYITGKWPENPAGLGFYNHHTGAGGISRPAQNIGNPFKWTSDDGSTVIVGEGGYWGGDGGGAETCVPSAGRFPTFASKVFQENVWNSRIADTWNDFCLSTTLWTTRMAGSGYSLFFWGTKMCENRLLEAEKFATFARRFGNAYPLAGDWYLYEVWGGLIKYNQHDIADAQGTPWQTIVSNTTNLNVQDAIVNTLKVADTTLNKSLGAISANVNTAGNGTSVIVYNALSWRRTDYVMVKTADLGFSSPISVKGPDGATVPSQVINDGGSGKLVFTAENVPSLGFKEYKALNQAAVTPVSSIAVADQNGVITMENEYCSIKINKTSGAMTSMYDKVNAREMLAGAGNQIASTTASPLFWDNCCNFYSHETGNMPATLAYKTPTSVQLADSGPSVARTRILYTENGVSWELSLMLFNKVPVITSRMVTSKLVKNNEMIVNFALNPAVSNGTKEWTAGVAYGHHKYVNRVAGTPTHKWANVANDAKNYSVALLENNCLIWSFYGAGGANDLRLPIIAEQVERYGTHWSKTDWEMSWGIWGHTGDWTDGTAQKGYEFNSPLIPRVEASHGGQLPKEYSFLTLDPENVVVTAVKEWEGESPTRADSLTMQVRFFEIDGKNTDAVFHFPSNRTVSAWESKGNEYGVYGNNLPVTTDAAGQKVTFTMGHNQIRSLKIQTPYSATPVWRDARSVGPISRMSINAGTMRLCNTKGQVIWQGGDLSQLGKLSRADGMYVLQVLGRDGKLMSVRKIWQSFPLNF